MSDDFGVSLCAQIGTDMVFYPESKAVTSIERILCKYRYIIICILFNDITKRLNSNQ
jgi:hypothetical protein